jgi:hypothetical protein
MSDRRRENMRSTVVVPQQRNAAFFIERYKSSHSSKQMRALCLTLAYIYKDE